MNVVQLGRRNADNCGDLASQIQERMQLHRMLIGLVGGPGKKAETQVDSSRVQGIDGVAELDPQIFLSIELASPSDEHLGEVAINSPIAHLVGIGQRAARNWAAETHMVEPLTLGSQADDNIAQAFAVSELCKNHAQKLVPAGESSCAMIASVSNHALPELVYGKIVEQLSKDGPSVVHARPSKLAQHGIEQNSNRSRLPIASQPYGTGTYVEAQKVNRTAVDH